jgi:hypothetical protein
MVVSFFFRFQNDRAAPRRRSPYLSSAQKGMQPLAADGASFYYYADGQRIALQPSLNWVSVKFASTDISRQSAALRNAATPLGSLDQARHIPTPELTLLPVQAGTTVQTLVQGINAMRATPSSFQAVNPVFQMADVEMVPTDQFIATFPSGKSLEDINALNTSLGAEIVEPLLGQENTFVLKVLPGAGLDTLAMANFYQESGAARNAAPDFVRIVQTARNKNASPTQPRRVRWQAQ